MAHRNDTVLVDELWDIFDKAREEAWKDVNAGVGEPDWEIAAGKIDIISYICHGVRGMNAAPRHTAETAKLPIFQDCESLVHIDCANGKSKNQINRYKSWICPECGWFVGEQYTPTWARGTPHNQRKCNFCSRCGQRIDWQSVESGQAPQKEDV